MADQQHTEERNPCSQSNGEAKPRDAFALAFEIEESLAHARTLNDLAQWIAEARGLIDGLRCAASIDAKLAERIKVHSLGLNSPEWGDAEVEGLQRLHMVIAENLQSIASASGLSASTAAQARGPSREH